MKVGVFWRKFRNVEFQKRISDNVFDDAYDEAYHHYTFIKENGYDAVMIEWKKDNPKETLKKIEEEKVDLVFNASSLEEVAFLTAFNIPFVGSGLDLVSLDKAARKKIVAYHELPTPKFFISSSPDDIPSHNLKFPLFVKPLRGRNSSGISDENIVENEEGLKKVIAKITEKIGQPALVEEYIKGREITVGIIGYENPTVLPLLEISYSGVKTNTFEHKMFDKEKITCPAPLPPEIEQKIKSTALSIYRVLNAKDYGRIDMILSEDGIPYFLEINTFAGLTMSTGKTHHGYMGYMAKASGLSGREFFGAIIESAKKRYF